MKKGEKVFFIAIGLLAIVLLVWRGGQVSEQQDVPDQGIPFYSDAPKAQQDIGAKLVRKFNCRECHTLWFVRDMTQSVPAPALDGMGSLRDESWLYDYFSAQDPQSIVPSRLKAKYRMPSYAHASEEERRQLAAYISSLKVEDWYLEETRKAAYEKLTGKIYEGHE